jgi:hypothetical protein
LYRLLLRLRMPRLPAFLVAFVAVYNLRTLDSLRYGASLESYVGMLLVATAAAFVYLNGGTKRSLVCLAASTYYLMVSGHPQWMYFGVLGAALFAVLFPWVAQAMDPRGAPPTEERVLRYAGHLGLGSGSGALLSAPYLLTFYFEYYRNNLNRAGAGSHAWTVRWVDNLRGVLCNFFFPFHADVHGAFGGSILFLLVALLPLAPVARIRVPRVLWVWYSLGVLAFLFAIGSRTGVHEFITEHVPLFGSFRVPGRIALWVPLIALPILGWLFQPDHRPALRAVVAASLALLVGNWLTVDMAQLPGDWYTPVKIFGGALPPAYDTLVLRMAAATLLALWAASRHRRLFTPLVGAAAVCVVASTWFCLRNGTWKEPKAANLTFEMITGMRKNTALTYTDPGEGMETGRVTEYDRHELKPDRPLGTIEHRAERVTWDEKLYQRLKLPAEQRPLLIEGDVAQLLPDRVANRDHVTLAHNTSNRLVFQAAAGQDGYFVLSQPRLSGFVARVDGVRVPIVTANLLYSAVFLPRGAHQVEFRFVSWPFMCGIMVVFATVVAWLRWLLGPVRRRALFAGAVCVAALALGILGERLLYEGPSFDTKFEWQAELR